MNNKRGGFGARLLLVLILMIASAVGGGYAYRILDGKIAVNEAGKYIDSVKISDYDTEEAVRVETFKEEAKKNLETAQTRKEVYEILDKYKESTGDILTKTEKELEEARRAVQNANNQNNSDQNNSGQSNNDGSQSQDDQSGGGSGSGIFGNLFGGKNNDGQNSGSAESEDPSNGSSNVSEDQNSTGNNASADDNSENPADSVQNDPSGAASGNTSLNGSDQDNGSDSGSIFD